VVNFSNSSQWAFFEIEGWGSNVGVANESKLQIDVNGEVVGAQTWKGTSFT